MVVLRKPDVAGTAAHTGISATRAPLLVAAQQLRDFNLPYQLGWTNEGGTKPFEAPSNANVGTVPVFADDIIVMATDGLFDNVALETVAEVCDAWEHDKGGASLAKRLCEEARRRSLDDAVDSPFALLAKENDVMWGGGMPDDVTVVCLEVS